MNAPLLSILIPGTPSRVTTYALPLIEKLSKQAEGKPVEILYFLDNKKRSVGGKRQGLLDIARGEYLAYCDDDDDVAPDYVEQIVAAIEEMRRVGEMADVITFDQRADIAGTIGVVNCRLGQLNEGFSPWPEVTRRNAWHFNAWRRELAQCCRFPEIMDGEDWAWAAQCCALAQTSTHIDKVLHYYSFRPAITEATGKNFNA